jgi:hypothetical protein
MRPHNEHQAEKFHSQTSHNEAASNARLLQQNNGRKHQHPASDQKEEPYRLQWIGPFGRGCHIGQNSMDRSSDLASELLMTRIRNVFFT